MDMDTDMDMDMDLDIDTDIPRGRYDSWHIIHTQKAFVGSTIYSK